MAEVEYRPPAGLTAREWEELRQHSARVSEQDTSEQQTEQPRPGYSKKPLYEEKKPYFVRGVSNP